jgi:PAP2 superfamily protein
MTEHEARAVWRQFQIGWIVLVALAAVLAVGLWGGGFTFGLAGALLSYGFVALYGAFAYFNAKIPSRRDPQVVYVLGCTAQIVFATCILAPLTYVAASFNLPMQDATLYAIDQALGLDWLGYVTFVSRHPLVAGWLTLGYTMIQWPIFIIPVVLAATHRYARLQEFILAFTLALAATAIISALVPAIGVFHHLGLQVTDFPNINGGAYLAQLRDLPPVRAGALKHLELFGLAGLVTFPSFHAASAALYAWAFWPVRRFRAIGIVANGVMLAATPIVGGHYFIDLIAGVAIAVLAIVAARAVGRRCRSGVAPAPVLAPAAASRTI